MRIESELSLDTRSVMVVDMEEDAFFVRQDHSQLSHLEQDSRLSLSYGLASSLQKIHQISTSDELNMKRRPNQKAWLSILAKPPSESQVFSLMIMQN